MLKLDDQWVWDLWLAPEKVEGLWHIFFLQAPRSLENPDLRHANATVGHATSPNLKDWTYLGTVLSPGESGEWDDRAIWTGSVIKGPLGIWYMFYTGTNKSREGGFIQRIGLATSSDLHNWEKVDGFLVEANPRWYERHDLNFEGSEVSEPRWYEEAWRDPWVMKDPNRDGWLMLITARSNEGEINSRGVIGVSHSDDLLHWQTEAPLYQGAEFAHFEVPQLLQLPDESWIITFCLSENNHGQARADRGAPRWSGNGVMRSKSAEGPWTVDEMPFLGEPHYAARIIREGDRYLAIAWLNYIGDEFQGYIDDPIDVTSALIMNLG